MKAFTDLEQSKTLSKILPLESADMYWRNGVSDKYIQCFTPFVINENGTNINFDYDIPCWSLAALLEQLKSEIILENKQTLFFHFNKYNDNNYEIRYTNS